MILKRWPVASLLLIVAIFSSGQSTPESLIKRHSLLHSRAEFAFLESNIHGNCCGFEKSSQRSYVIRDVSQSVKLDQS